MFANKLKLNPDKTEFILIGSQKNCNQLLSHFLINILGNQVSQAQSVRNLGVVFNSNFTFSNLVTQVIKSTRVQMRDLYRIRPLLDLNTSVLLADALVSSRLDYCNSLIAPQLKNPTGYQLDTGYDLKLVSLHTKFSPRVNQFT